MSMQRRFFCGLVLAMSNFALAEANTFTDITNWTGTGANQAAMVLDWHNGETNSAMAWGIRFDGAITADSAIRQILASDNRLYGAANGNFWLAFGYDADGAGVQGINLLADPANPYTPTNGLIDFPGTWSLPGSSAADANDYYGYDSTGEATDSNFAVYVPDTTVYDDKGNADWADDDAVIGASTTYTGIAFAEAAQGVGTMFLQDESWFVFSHGESGVWPAPHQGLPSTTAPMAAAASVPEPLTMSLLAMGGLGLLRRRKK